MDPLPETNMGLGLKSNASADIKGSLEFDMQFQEVEAGPDMRYPLRVNRAGYSDMGGDDRMLVLL